MTLSESDIIQRFFHKNPDNKFSTTARPDITIGIGDDAAVVQVPDGMELLSAVDTIVEGVHFPAGLDAADIGYRALAVNLSDMAAMGGQPEWALLSLSLPSIDEDWLASFCSGFFELANSHDVALIGGDLVKGPLVVTITLLGVCPTAMAIRRDAARAGDLLYVTGSPGAAALGLKSIMQSDNQYRDYESAFRRPQPRIAEGLALRGIATAMIDVSDGLLQDAGRIAAASDVQVIFDSQAIESIASGGLQTALSGGDDYELCFTINKYRQDQLAALSAQWQCGPHQIGQIAAGQGVVMPGHDLSQFTTFDHFISE